MEKAVIVKLKSLQKVKDFVRCMESFSCDIDACQGRYRAQASSVLGLFSLNLLEPIIIEWNSNEEDEEIYRILEEFAFEE